MSQKTKTEKSEAVPKAMAPQTKRYDEAFKQAANWIKTGQSGTRIAAELGINHPSLKEWMRRYYGDASPERDELAAENRALKAELAWCGSSGIFKETLGIVIEPSSSATKPLQA